MKNRRKKILLGGIIPIIILLSMTVLPIITTLFGEEVLLETRPYDPRDLFRGDYVVLSYEIDEVDLDKFPDVLKEVYAYEKYRGKNLYAVLKKDGDYHEVDYMTYNKPQDGIYLTTKLNYFYPFQQPETKMDTIHVDYNLDRFFVPENTGKDLEELSRKGELVAKIKVLNGYAILVEVIEKK